MCGIFGVLAGPDSALREADELAKQMRELFLLSESRGKEAAGLAALTSDRLIVYREPIPAHDLVKAKAFKAIVTDATRDRGARAPLAFIGHSRLETDGVRLVNRNNQPVLTGGLVGVHNGIVVNHRELWSRNQNLDRQSELDSEVLFVLLRRYLGEGLSLQAATGRVFGDIEGAASIATLFDDLDAVLLATNNGSLYFRAARDEGSLIFASESYILQRLCRRNRAFADAATEHIRPGNGVIVHLPSLRLERFSLAGDAKTERASSRPSPRVLDDRSPPPPDAPAVRRTTVDFERIARDFPYESMVERLRRCTRCVLPETMPFIDFDDEGVCSYCRAYRPIELHGHEALEQIAREHRRSDGRPDCVVGVSGGRDSIYGLHYIKTELGLNPVAYTYDWGMVTDLARRNTSRICGKLGIEHILVSADIPLKREYIRKNVEAWLAKPSLGTIPLFMAGDKAYFHHLRQVSKQVDAPLMILCENLLERTDFKTGFAGVAPAFDDDHVYTLPLSAKLRLAAFYAGSFLSNPKYLNASVIDTAKAFAYYYLIDREYYNLYRYVLWDEDTVNRALLGTYDFELAEDTKSTWRIGDGTAAFYNYIYYAVAGMSENDTFRSNQIRAGALDRDTALERIDVENRPRFQSIQWYLDTIGTELGLDAVLRRIQAIPKLY